MRSSNLSNPLFVVGFYRSGTSLLHALLNQHPAIALMYECDILKLTPMVGARSNHRDWANRLEFWNQSLSRHGLDETSNLVAANRTDAATALYRAYAARKGAMVLGEKSPYYHNCLPRLAKDFPNSRVIILWRSPEEILNSIRRAASDDRFFISDDWAQRVVLGVKAMARGTAALRSMGHSVHEVNYRTLVRDQAKSLSDICQFLKIDFDARMTQLAGSDTTMLPAGEHHRNVRSGKIIAESRASHALSEHDLATLRSHFPDSATVPWNSTPQPLAALHPTVSDCMDATRFALRDALVRRLYAYCPTSVLKRWRNSRVRRFQASRPSLVLNDSSS